MEWLDWIGFDSMRKRVLYVAVMLLAVVRPELTIRFNVLTNPTHDRPTSSPAHTTTPPLFIQEPLVYDAEHHALLSESVGVRYPISHETGIPNLIPREATLVQAEGAGDREAEK